MKIKEGLKGRYFDDIEGIKANVMVPLKAIPQKEFQNSFEGWSRQHIVFQGEYKGDHSNIQQEGI